VSLKIDRWNICNYVFIYILFIGIRTLCLTITSSYGLTKLRMMLIAYDVG